MEQITHSHHQSKNIEDNKIQCIGINTWVIHSVTLGEEPYTVYQ